MYVCMFVCVWMYVGVDMSWCACDNEKTTYRSWFSFYHVDTNGQTQVFRLCAKHLYLLSHSTGF